jgi:hypothetical protein
MVASFSPPEKMMRVPVNVTLACADDPASRHRRKANAPNERWIVDI